MTRIRNDGFGTCHHSWCGMPYRTTFADGRYGWEKSGEFQGTYPTRREAQLAARAAIEADELAIAGAGQPRRASS